MTVLKTLTFSLTITAAAAKGYCNDRDSSCANWGKNGECEGDNADAVKNLCPHTCGVCRWRAPRWRRDHSHARRSLHTTVYIAASLLLVAPAPLALSASQTSAHRPRRPHRPHPDSWPRPRRSHACGDMESHCEAWAKSGECEKSPDYMKKAHTPPPSRLPFPASHSHAGSHSTAAPHTSAPLARPALAASPPSPPPSLTAQECPTACGLCNPVCSDLHDDCNHWYKEGACETNPWYMYLNCAVSCGVCKPMCKDKEGGCPPHASPRYQHPHTTPAHRLTAPPLPRPSPIPSTTIPRSPTTRLALAAPSARERTRTSLPLQENDCPGWSSMEECSKNAGHMLLKCPNSCSVCEARGASAREEGTSPPFTPPHLVSRTAAPARTSTPRRAPSG